MFTPNTLIWIAAVIVATGLLLSATARRESSLIEALRGYVDGYMTREAAKREPAEADSPAETPSPADEE